MKTLKSSSGRGGRRGSVMVEFTLLSPLLILLFLGTITFGSAFHTYNRLEESVRAGARYASMKAYNAYDSADPTIPPCATVGGCPTFTISGSSQFLTSVQNMVVYGTPAPSTKTPPPPVVQGLTTDNVDVRLDVVGFGLNKPVAIRTVTVAIKNFPVPMLGGTITLNKPITQFRYVGTYSPADIT